VKEEGRVRRFFSCLRFRLLLIVVIALLPAFGLVIYAAVQQRNDAARSARGDSLRLAQLAAAEQAQLAESATIAGLEAPKEAG